MSSRPQLTRRSTRTFARVQQPIGFADIVERVKPSVISVRVKIAEKQASNDSSPEDSPFPSGLPDGTLLQALRPVRMESRARKVSVAAVAR